MKVIDQTLLDKVSAQAKESPRLRMNFNFHQSLEDKCQGGRGTGHWHIKVSPSEFTVSLNIAA